MGHGAWTLMGTPGNGQLATEFAFSQADSLDSLQKFLVLSLVVIGDVIAFVLVTNQFGECNMGMRHLIILRSQSSSRDAH